MDEYDIEKDFASKPLDANNSCKIYGLSELGWEKHLKHKNMLSTIENRFKNMKAREKREKEQYNQILYPDNNLSKNENSSLKSSRTPPYNPINLPKSSSSSGQLIMPEISPQPLYKCNSQRITPKCTLLSKPIKLKKPQTRLNRNNRIHQLPKSYSSYHNNTNFSRNSSPGHFERMNAIILRSVLASSNPSYDKEDDKTTTNNAIYEKIINENDKLKMIYLATKARRLLNQSYLPSLYNSQRAIIVDVSQNTKGNSSYLGEKFDPFNYKLNNPKNRVRRNSFGNLFSH